MQTLLDLDYPKLRIVAVDDRSRDDTGKILDELAAGSERLAVVHVEELPPGWLGKNHANWIGAAMTESPWILFSDGDVHFHPDALKRSIRFATRSGVDHLVAFPRIIPGGLWENLMVFTFTMFFFFRFHPWLARTRSKHFFIGVGAFNLISRSAYEKIGTHRRLAFEVADDIKLGKLVKRCGLRQGVIDGGSMVRVRWQVGLRGIVRGLTKNAFAGMNYSLPLTIVTSIAIVFAFLVPYPAAVLASGEARYGYLCAVVLLHVAFAATVVKAKCNPLISLLLPVGEVIFLYIIWRSTFITLRQGGVVWRDTFYPLDELKKGLV